MTHALKIVVRLFLPEPKWPITIIKTLAVSEEDLANTLLILWPTPAKAKAITTQQNSA